MSNEKKRGNREVKKAKKPVAKVNAAAPSTKNMVAGAVKTANRG